MSLFRSSYSWIEFGAHSALLYVRKQSPYFPARIVRRATQKAFNAIGKRGVCQQLLHPVFCMVYASLESADPEFFLPAKQSL